MLVIYDSLRPTEQNLILQDLAWRRSRESLWQEGNRYWNPELTNGFTGSVLTSELTGIVKGMVVGVVSRSHPVRSSDRIRVQYCRWLEDSGINPHRDERYRWAATLYLNAEWYPEWGGLFMVPPEPILPLLGTLIINTAQEPHAVSRVRAGAPERLSLQVWAL